MGVGGGGWERGEKFGPGTAGRRRVERGTRGRTGSWTRGGAWEAESPLLVDGVATFKRPERTGVQRGKTFGRNLLPKARKAGEKEAGRDLKCLSNFQNTPNTPSGDERSRCSRRSQRPTGDDRGQEDTASEGTRTRRFAGSLQAAPGVFVLIFYGLFLFLSSFPLGFLRVEESHPISKKVSSGAWSPRCPRLPGAGGGAHQWPARWTAPSLLFVAAFGEDLSPPPSSFFSYLLNLHNPAFLLFIFPPLFPEHESKHFPNQQRKVRTLARQPGRTGRRCGWVPLPGHLTQLASECVCPPPPSPPAPSRANNKYP
ncbi:uncharacterized protein LOC111827431 [Myotis lucifugus]|uniref:uncharacterized protein LOC111827431 n=1 Tax=Myotis lucifugus TaxID=59463 RepID=UPI000CCC4098|nr:uncharacterized protein LOC111827431 [Myotis lucifugus]